MLVNVVEKEAKEEGKDGRECSSSECAMTWVSYLVLGSLLESEGGGPQRVVLRLRLDDVGGLAHDGAAEEGLHDAPIMMKASTSQSPFPFSDERLFSPRHSACFSVRNESYCYILPIHRHVLALLWEGHRPQGCDKNQSTETSQS